MPRGNGALGQTAEEMEDVQSRAARPLCEPDRAVVTVPFVAAARHANGKRAALDKSLQPAPNVTRL